MRAQEFLTEYQKPKIHQDHRDGLDLEVRSNDKNLSIYAYDRGGRELAHVHFDRNSNNLVPYDLEVGEDYRGQGVWQHIAQKLGAEWAGSITEIARIPQGDFGDADTLTAPKYEVEKKPLPGGSGFTYGVGKPGPEDLEIMIFDGNTLAAELDLFYTRDVTKSWRVSTVAVNPQYRSRGLGKALYGIALSILRLTLEAGDTQTKHGQRMWLMLNSIPGVEVLGYNMERTSQYKPGPNDKIIAQDKTWTRYTFPVQPGTHSMRSGRRGTGMYTSQASMIAKWTGQ